MPKILIREGTNESVFELFEDEATIGRGAANAVQVADAHASKHHAVVRRVAGRPKLVDLESKNGTRVNGEFRNQRWLEHGDVVSIGEMTITYDGSGEAPAAAPGRVAEGAAHAGTALPGRASGRSLPGSARARPRPSGAGARRDRVEDGEEEGPRVPPRRGGNSMAVAVLVGGGLVGLLALMFFMLSRGGATSNAMALAEAKRIAASGKVAEAVDYLKRNADPTERDGYVSVKRQLDYWEPQVANAALDDKAAAAESDYKKIYRDFIEQWKNGLSDEALGGRLLRFSEDYQGTLKVMELLNSQVDPNPKFRALMEKARPK